jgi:hypothetical protein
MKTSNEEDQKPAALVLDATSVESNSDATTSYTNFASPTFASASTLIISILKSRASPSDNRKTAPSSTIPAQNSDWPRPPVSTLRFLRITAARPLRLPSAALLNPGQRIFRWYQRGIASTATAQATAIALQLEMNFVAPIKLFVGLIKLTCLTSSGLSSRVLTIKKSL